MDIKKVMIPHVGNKDKYRDFLTAKRPNNQ